MKRKEENGLNNEQLYLILEQIAAYLEEVGSIEKTLRYLRRIQKGLKRTSPNKANATDHNQTT